MIPDIQSCLLCEDVRQERSGKFILIGLLDAVQVPRMPVRMQKLCMVTRWCSGEGEFVQSSKIYKPDQTSVMVTGKEIPVRLPNPQSITTNVEIFLNVTIEEPGTHWVEVVLDNDLKLRYPIGVHLVQQKGQQPPNKPNHPNSPNGPNGPSSPNQGGPKPPGSPPGPPGHSSGPPGPRPGNGGPPSPPQFT